MATAASATPGADRVAKALGTGKLAAGWIDTAALASETITLTNKRITRRVVVLTDAANVSSNADATDVGDLTTTQNFTLDNPTGTPTDGQLLEYRVKSASSFSIAYGAAFRATADLVLPTATTGSSKWDRLLFEWNADSATWDILAKNFGA
jgi:hypothetical protein